MGTWDIGFFDNDMACDWENELSENKNILHIEKALNDVINDTDDEGLDIDIANKAIAASEALARLLGNDGEHNSYTEHLDKWAEEFDEELPESLLKLALDALNIVQSLNSEVRQFWTIRGEYTAWNDSIENLKGRLKAKNDK